MSFLLEIICMAEVDGELEEPTHKYRRYWVHAIHSSIVKDMRFQVFYNNLKRYPEKFFGYYRISIFSLDKIPKRSLVRSNLTKKITHL